jgi:hypothetical protein
MNVEGRRFVNQSTSSQSKFTTKPITRTRERTKVNQSKQINYILCLPVNLTVERDHLLLVAEARNIHVAHPFRSIASTQLHRGTMRHSLIAPNSTRAQLTQTAFVARQRFTARQQKHLDCFGSATLSSRTVAKRNDAVNVDHYLLLDLSSTS